MFSIALGALSVSKTTGMSILLGLVYVPTMYLLSCIIGFGIIAKRYQSSKARCRALSKAMRLNINKYESNLKVN